MKHVFLLMKIKWANTEFSSHATHPRFQSQAIQLGGKKSENMGF